MFFAFLVIYTQSLLIESNKYEKKTSSFPPNNVRRDRRDSCLSINIPMPEYFKAIEFRIKLFKIINFRGLVIEIISKD